jgi:hypothetical protein
MKVLSILFLKAKEDDPDDPDSKRTGGANEYILPVVGGALAGLFTKGTDPDNPGRPDDNTALALNDLKKSANILDQKEGMAAGLNFLPSVASRKYSPDDMIKVYQKAANGGRIGYENGGDPLSEFEVYRLGQMGYDVASKGVEPFGGLNVLRDILKVNSFAMGGRIIEPKVESWTLVVWKKITELKVGLYLLEEKKKQMMYLQD